MDAQVLAYLRQRSPARDDLFVLWGGANDFFLGQTNPAAPVTFIRDQILALADAGAENFLVVNLPRNFGNSPLNSGLMAHAERFNFHLALALDEVRSTHEALTIIEFDYYSLFEEVRADPGAFGFRNSVNPACLNCATVNQTLVPNPDEYFFWDDVHPTGAAHRLIGVAAHSALVPEPSTLLLMVISSGILCLAVCCRRLR
jgi:phospholipase/lecithinase/hemolysin